MFVKESTRVERKSAKARRTNAERTADTRARLMAAMRKLVTARGFAGTSTEDILSEAHVTRGALYHHFEDKAQLFEAVCVAMHNEAQAEMTAATSKARNPVDALEQASLAWIDYTARPDVRRFLVLEAPTVLGWERWNELDLQYGFAELVAGVKDAIESGALRRMGSEELGVLLNGALNHAALWAGQASDKSRVERAKRAVKQLLQALRA